MDVGPDAVGQVCGDVRDVSLNGESQVVSKASGEIVPDPQGH